MATRNRSGAAVRSRRAKSQSPVRVVPMRSTRSPCRSILERHEQQVPTGPTPMEPKADGTRLGHIETGRRAHGLHELTVERVERTQPVARTNQSVARGSVDEAEPFEIPEVEDQVEARPGRVS